MKTIEITREQAVAQIENDRNTKNELKASPFTKFEDIGFYTERIAQLENILKNGRGFFYLFRNEKAEIVIK